MSERFDSGRVQVRRTRLGRSLRVDGTLASWYAPGSPLTGSVWDALAVPMLALPPARRRSLLILGLGGGSVARVARAISPSADIVGVECDAEVLAAARRYFDLDALDVEVVHGDARRYLGRSRRRFDMIVEDVFIGRGRAVHKPDWLPVPGLSRAKRLLRPGGVLVSNSIDEMTAVSRVVRDLFPSAIRIDVDGYDNHVIVGGPKPVDARMLRAAVAAHPVLSTTLDRLVLRTLAR
jgi:spermidine synthase